MQEGFVSTIKVDISGVESLRQTIAMLNEVAASLSFGWIRFFAACFWFGFFSSAGRHLAAWAIGKAFGA